MHEGAIEKFVAYGGRGLESLILSGGFSSVQHGEEMGLDLLPRLRWAPVLRLPGKPRWRWQARVWPPFAGTWKDCLEKQQLQDKILEWDALPAWLGSAPPPTAMAALPGRCIRSDQTIAWYVSLRLPVPESSMVTILPLMMSRCWRGGSQRDRTKYGTFL